MRLLASNSLALTGFALILLTGSSSGYTDRKEARDAQEGYRATVGYKDGFLAAGSGGRIDWISSTGQVMRSEMFPGEDFNCLLAGNRQVIAAGDQGSILVCSDEGEWQKMDSGTGKDIHTLAAFKGIFLAGADDGRIFCCDSNTVYDSVPLPVKGNIVSLSARASDCFGVTDAGEIIRSEDGKNWEILDFNQKYSGFYGTCCFRKVLAVKNRIAIAGVKDDGTPVLFISHLGGVWTERSLNYTDDQGMTGYLTDAPNDIFFDGSEDQFFLACDNGKLIQLPSCTQCNELIILSGDDLECMAGNGQLMVVAGENFFAETMNIR
jgi:hypothetical protein